MPLPHERPPVVEDVHTADLPALPQRDRSIPAARWVEAPAALLHLGDDLGTGDAVLLRRIGRYLVWRSGPPHDRARSMAIAADDFDERWTFDHHPGREGEGVGPDGVRHTRFRTWKESLRDAPPGA